MTNLYHFVNGTLADANEVNTNSAFMLGRQLDAIGTTNIKHFVYDSSVVTGSTTATLIGGDRYLPSGSLYDTFGDGVIDTSRYQINFVSGTISGDTTGSSEAGGSLTATHSGDPSGAGDAISTEIIWKQDFGAFPGSTSVMMNVNLITTFGGAAGGAAFYMKYGGVTIWSSSPSGGNTTHTGGGSFYCIKSANLGSWSVYLNGTFVSTVNVSGSTLGSFSFLVDSRDDNPVTNIIQIHELRANPPIGGSSFTDTIWHADANGIGSWVGSGVYVDIYTPEEMGSLTKTLQVSADNGATWTTIGSTDIQKMVKITTTNTGSVVFRRQYTMGSTIGFYRWDGLRYVTY